MTLNTVNANNVVAEQAFTVFEDVILEEIASENERFLEERKRLLPSLELIRNIVFTVFDESITLPIDSGNLVDNGKLWQLSVEGKFAPFSLFDPCLTITSEESGVVVFPSRKLYMERAGLALGSFPHPFSSEVYIWHDNNVGELRCALVLSSDPGQLVMVEGKLEKIGPQDLHQGTEYLTNQINAAFSMGFSQPTNLLIDSPDPLFTVQSVTLEYNSALQESLRYISATQNIDPEEPLADKDMTESEHLRYSIASAYPIGKLYESFKQNQKLRLENKSLVSVHKYIQTVEIKHSSGTISFRLDQGAEKNDSWVCYPKDATGNSFMIAMNDIGRVQILLTGQPIHCEYGPGYSGTQPGFDPTRGILQITYSQSVTLLGTVDFGDCNGDQNELQRRRGEAADNFRAKLFRIVAAGPRLQDDSLLFPSWFQLRVLAVIFDSKYQVRSSK